MGEPDSPVPSESSEASSLSLVSRDLFHTKNKVRELEHPVSTLSATVQFQEDKITNLEHQRASLDHSLSALLRSHEGLAQQVLDLQAELRASRNSAAYRAAETVAHEISVARVNRRVAEIGRILHLRNLD